MPRTLLRRHEQYQSRAVFSERRRRREVTVETVIMGGDIAARRPGHKTAYSTGGMVRIQATTASISLSFQVL